MPRYAAADEHIERGRRHSNGLCQRFLCFLYAAGLTKRGGKPAIGIREIGIGADPAFCSFNRSVVFPGQIEADRNIEQTQVHIRVAWVEPDTVLESLAPFFQIPTTYHPCPKLSICTGRVRTARKSQLKLRESALIIPPPHQLQGKTCTRFRVVAVECDCPAR